MPVTRLLLTGTEDQIFDFHVVASSLANFITRLNQTCYYTVFTEHEEIVREMADKAGLQIQVLTNPHPGQDPLL